MSGDGKGYREPAFAQDDTGCTELVFAAEGKGCKELGFEDGKGYTVLG